jgi:hypothetical protein
VCVSVCCFAADISGGRAVASSVGVCVSVCCFAADISGGRASGRFSLLFLFLFLSFRAPALLTSLLCRVARVAAVVEGVQQVARAVSRYPPSSRPLFPSRSRSLVPPFPSLL